MRYLLYLAVFLVFPVQIARGELGAFAVAVNAHGNEKFRKFGVQLVHLADVQRIVRLVEDRRKDAAYRGCSI